MTAYYVFGGGKDDDLMRCGGYGVCGGYSSAGFLWWWRWYGYL